MSSGLTGSDSQLGADEEELLTNSVLKVLPAVNSWDKASLRDSAYPFGKGSLFGIGIFGIGRLDGI